MGRRVDAEDTIDVVTRFFLHWQAEGFGVSDVECHVEYEAPKPGARKLPIEATVTVRLIPSR